MTWMKIETCENEKVWTFVDNDGHMMAMSRTFQAQEKFVGLKAIKL